LLRGFLFKTKVSQKSEVRSQKSEVRNQESVKGLNKWRIEILLSFI